MPVKQAVSARGVLAGATNGVSSALLVTPGPDNQNGITVKIPRANYGVSQPYGTGQIFEVIEEGSVDVTDNTATGPVLLRLDRYGGLGTNGGLHLPTGFRASVPPPGQQIWFQPYADTYGMVHTRYSAQTLDVLLCTRADVTTALRIFGDGTYYGSIFGYGLNGSSVAFGLVANDAGNANFRCTLSAVTATVITLGLLAAASQTADLLQARDSGNAILSRINKAGYIMTRKTATPVLGDMVDGEVAIWLDTAGNAVKFAARIGGVLKAGTVAVA